MSRKFRLATVNPTMTNDDLKVDREHLRVYGTVAALAGVEALGHDLWSDQKTIEVLAALGNKAFNGIRMRFGHPGISDNAMGRKVGKAYNFRVAGNKLLHDVRMLEPAKRSPIFDNDVVEYIFDMAEQHPEEIAESVVILIDAVWTLDDGREINADDDSEWPDDIVTDGDGRPANATTPYPVIRPLTFYYTDFVSEGALTHDGLFSAAQFFDGTSQHAAQIFEVMDDLQATHGLTVEDMRRKADALFNTYTTLRRGVLSMSEKEEKVATSDAPEAKPQVDVDLSALVEESAEVADTVEAEPEPQYVTLEQYNLLVERFNALTEQFNQVVQVAQNQQKILSALTRQSVKLTGEPVVKEVVTGNVAHLTPLAQVNPMAEIKRGNIGAPPAQSAKPKSATSNGSKLPGLGGGLRVSGN